MASRRFSTGSSSPLAERLGWEHVLVASRLVAASATIATGLVLAWLVDALTRDKRLAAFAALVYLTSDALLYHGWLAYTDPLFAFFTFAAIACLWVAAVRRSIALAWVAAAALSCAALTKGQNCLPVLRRRRARSPVAGATCARSCCDPASSFRISPRPRCTSSGIRYLTGGAQQGTDSSPSWRSSARSIFGDYLHQLWWFPLEIDASLRAREPPRRVFLAARKEPAGAKARPHDAAVAIGAWIALLNFLPYWLWPHTASRYVMPLYPLAAFLIAHALWRLIAARMRVGVNCLIATIVIKYVAALWVFPAYQREYRGDYAQRRGRDRGARARDARSTRPMCRPPALASRPTSTHIDFRSQPLQWPPREWTSGFVLSHTENPEVGNVFRKFPLGRNDVYLLCRGVACAERSRIVVPVPRGAAGTAV